jgi:hypothetical protein
VVTFVWAADRWGGAVYNTHGEGKGGESCPSHPSDKEGGGAGGETVRRPEN